MSASCPRAERARLEEVPHGRAPWRHWGPYLSERAWGTVREDYSADGDAWASFPHDHARSRAYRWNEDGLAGICDDRQTLCLALAFWNGRDPILKERIFGLTNAQGNHGEDAKEYWWYLDSTPTHSWMRWRYMYPQPAYPYQRLVAENGARTRLEPEFELVDTGIFDGGYWEITADYAKASPEDICLRVRVRNAGPEAAIIDVLPTLWFRNTWSWGRDPTVDAPTPHGGGVDAAVHDGGADAADDGGGTAAMPTLRAVGGSVVAAHPDLGVRVLRGDGAPALLFCENETNLERLYGVPPRTPFPKDGIADHVVHGLPTVNPEQWGTKCAFHHHLTVDPGATAEIRLRLAESTWSDLGSDFDAVMATREAEADEFYAGLTPPGCPPGESAVLRQALAGMLWSKQYYHYDVATWLDGDPAGPTPPPERLRGRNADWRHLDNRDVISMPDKWEYPWYAAWDLGFHVVSLAHVDPEFAKSQLLLLCREWYMHPNGQLPAYEWSLGDVNPPVHAWAALNVFHTDGARDHDFLERVFHKLLINFTWWVNRKDADGSNVFEGGFLGLDNIGAFDRSSVPPELGRLEQSDGTAWMAMYCLSMLEIALTLATHDSTYEDVATKFFEHFTLIALALNRQGLWNEQEGFYYDVLARPDGERIPLRARSMVGLVPLFAVTVLQPGMPGALPDFTRRLRWYLGHRPEVADVVEHIHVPGMDDRRLLSVVSPERLRRILHCALAEDEFLSPGGLRALSRYHRDHPLAVDIGGMTARVDYEPAESTSGLFGGNSNWRGPVWYPLNRLFIAGLRRFHMYLGDGFTVECPTGSGRMMTLAQVTDEISRRLLSVFLDRDGRRPVFGDCDLLQRDPAWHDLLSFPEYLDGDTSKGLGASHQTGWTGLIADVILRRGRDGDPAPTTAHQEDRH